MENREIKSTGISVGEISFGYRILGGFDHVDRGPKRPADIDKIVPVAAL